MTSKEAVKLARIEFEKDLEYDTNNEWDKRVVEGLKKAERDLEILDMLKSSTQLREKTFKHKEEEIGVAIIETYAVVVKTSDNYNLLKDWLDE